MFGKLVAHFLLGGPFEGREATGSLHDGAFLSMTILIESCLVLIHGSLNGGGDLAVSDDDPDAAVRDELGLRWSFVTLEEGHGGVGVLLLGDSVARYMLCEEGETGLWDILEDLPCR